MIGKNFLQKEYVTFGHSLHEIALGLGCSDNKVAYWLQKHNIPKRTISEAIYLQNNPSGDPFRFNKPSNYKDWFLYGIGLGLFWGEGNKVNKHSVRLGNTDPALIRVFLDFLVKIYRIDESKLRFGLQIFSDTSPDMAKKYWIDQLKVNDKQFQKVVVTKTNKKGTYRNKNKYGVLTIYFSNIKLRDNIISAITKLQTTSYAILAQSVERTHGKS